MPSHRQTLNMLQANDKSHRLERRSNYKRTSDTDYCILNILQPWIKKTLIDKLKSSTVQNHSVIDVGCGNQPFRTLIESHAANYTSFDAVQNEAENVDSIGKLDDADLPSSLIDCSFDVVICTEVLEHVYNWPAAFTNLMRLTKVGGVVILTCPFFWPLHEAPHDYWRPTPFAIRRIDESHGFLIEEAQQAGGLWDVFGTALGNARFSIPLLGKLGLPFSTIAWAMRKLLLAVLRLGFLQKIIRIDSLQGPFYLSNLFVLRRLA